ncbi:MAG: ATP synthase subunit b' [Mycoplasmataceae bacterium]|nr:MAG: ATP synthase subunit b' [Mycoplasmataceae bacterium]
MKNFTKCNYDEVMKELNNIEEGWITLKIKPDLVGRFYCLLAGIEYDKNWNLSKDLPKREIYETLSIEQLPCGYKHRLACCWFTQTGNLDTLYQIEYDFKGKGWFSTDNCNYSLAGSFLKCSTQTAGLLPLEFREYLDNSTEIINLVGSQYTGINPAFPTFKNIKESEKIINERDLLVSKLAEIKQNLSDVENVKAELQRNLINEQKLNETAVKNLKIKFPNFVDSINQDDLKQISLNLSKELGQKNTTISALEAKVNNYSEQIVENEIIAKNKVENLDLENKNLSIELKKAKDELDKTKRDLEEEISHHNITIGINSIRRQVLPEKFNNLIDFAHGVYFINRVAYYPRLGSIGLIFFIYLMGKIVEKTIFKLHRWISNSDHKEILSTLNNILKKDNSDLPENKKEL